MQEITLHSKKISYSSYDELEEKINKLGINSDYSVSIGSTTPECTDTKQWCLLTYWKTLMMN